MKKAVLILWIMGVGVLFSGGIARGEWTALTGAPSEVDIQWVEVHPKYPKILYAASEKSVYRTEDAGEKWKRILNIHGENKIRFIHAQADEAEEIFVSTTKGVRKSSDAGKSWKTIYHGLGAGDKTVYWISKDPVDSRVLWLGTAQGLVKVLKDGSDAKKSFLCPRFTFIRFGFRKMEKRCS